MKEKEFYNYIFNEYKPSPFEEVGGEARGFPEHLKYGHIFRQRVYFVYREVERLIKKGNGKKIKLLDMAAILAILFGY